MGVSRAAVAGKDAEVAFDTSAGQGTALPGPAGRLVIAFAACVLKNVERMAGMQRFRYVGTEIEVSAEREERPPRIAAIRYRLELVTEEPHRRVELLHRNVARQGTIYNTLAQACAVTAVLRPPSLAGARVRL